MYFVSVTRLRIRSWRFLPAFLYFTLLSLIQAKRADGNRGTSLMRDAHLVFWTITVWRDEYAMREFAITGAPTGDAQAARVVPTRPRTRTGCRRAPSCRPGHGRSTGLAGEGSFLESSTRRRTMPYEIFRHPGSSHGRVG